FRVFITVSTAAITRNDPIREHPHSVVVTEGGWAHFTCAIKLPGMIRWRIGDFENNASVYNSLNTEEQYRGNDLRVEQAWLQGLTGCNITVSVVDDGIDFRHPDLWPNFAPSASFDHLAGENYQHRHGTRRCGVVAGAQDNSTCGVGVAHQCNLRSIKLLDGGGRTDLEEAEALSYAVDIIDVYSNSWGPYDTGAHVSGPGTLTQDVFKMGATIGRNGKGSIYVWAGGNGGDEDDCGYVSSIYTIAVGAIGVDGHASSFDEQCCAKMVVAYVTNKNGHMAIVTTDPGRKCTLKFGGTSAATPMVSGAIALALEVK
ncbi:Neuroendocrine convertase 2, partial [Geodia barretti]